MTAHYCDVCLGHSGCPVSGEREAEAEAIEEAEREAEEIARAEELACYADQTDGAA
jgi:hypothetical protein